MGSSNSSPVVHVQELNDSYRRNSFYEDERLTNLSRYKLIWIDKLIDSIENIERQANLKNLIEDLFVYQNLISAQEKIKEIKNEKIFIILNDEDNYCEEFILNIHRRNEIAAIYLYSENVQCLRQLLRPIRKVKYVYNNFDCIFKKFQKDLNAYENLQNFKFIPNTFYTSDRSSRIQFYLIENLSNIDNTELDNEMKQILFETYENCYENNERIKEFKERFEVSTSFYWFIEEPLIYRLFNNICQKGYWNSIWKFEYLIQCLFIQLKKEHLLFMKNLDKKSIIYVYLGQLMNILEFKRLKMLIGKNILITNFVLANFDKDKIIDHINRCEPSQNEISFIFKIIINTNLRNTQPYAPIYFNNQQKLLFMLGTHFHVLDFILNPHDQIPIVLLQLHNNTPTDIQPLYKPIYQHSI